MDVCPRRGRERELRRNRALRLDHPAIRLDDSNIIRRHPESREAAHQFRCRNHLVGQIVDPGAAQRSLDQRAIGRTDLGDAGHMQKLAPRRSFELTPEAVGVPQQRHVGGMLEVPEPNDARAAMGGAAVVTGSMALDPQHPLASACQVLRRCAPHRAEAADHDIEMRHNVGLDIRCANRTYCDDAFAAGKGLPARMGEAGPCRPRVRRVSCRRGD